MRDADGWVRRMGLGYWLQAPVTVGLAGGLLWAGSRSDGWTRPVLLLVGSVAAVYAVYLLLMPLVVQVMVMFFEAAVRDADGPADGEPPAPRPAQRRGLPPAPRGGRHWVEQGSTRLVRRRLLVDDRGRILHEDEHDRRTDLALGAGLAGVVAVAVLSGRLEGAIGGVAFALAAMSACALLAVAGLRVAGRVTVSRLGS